MKRKVSTPAPPSPCGACGGEVQLVVGKRRTREHRGARLPIPEDLGLPRCTACGSEAMSVEVSARLDEVMRQALRRRLGAQVKKIREAQGATQQRIAEALGVTAPHLSSVLSGRTAPSAPLVKLVDVLAEVPGAYERARGGEPFSYVAHMEPAAPRLLTVRDMVAEPWPVRKRPSRAKATRARGSRKGGPTKRRKAARRKRIRSPRRTRAGPAEKGTPAARKKQR